MDNTTYLQTILKEEKNEEFKELAESLIKAVSHLQAESYPHSESLPEEIRKKLCDLSEAQSQICKFLIFNKKFL